MSWKRLLVLILALGQILSSVFSGFTGRDSFSNPIITPAGYAFSIWGVITFGCLVYGIYQLLPKQRKNKLYDQMAFPLMVTFTGFSVWLYAATKNWLWATVAIFFCMFLSLWWAYSHILRSKQKFTALENTILQGTFGLYIGWATVATVINIASALHHYGYIYSDTRSVTIYILILLAALINALIGLKRIRYNIYYLATILWAFIAVSVRTYERGSEILTLTSLFAVGVVVFVWLRNKKVLFRN